MRNVNDCHLWPQECCIQAPQNLTILGPQSHAKSRQVYADLAWAPHNCTCPGVYDWMPLSSSPGFNGRPAESCSRRASANSGSTDGATHTILQKAMSGISSLSQWQRIRWQVHMWRGSLGPHAIPVIKESPPARPRVQSGWTWSGDLSKGVARGWGEKWALDTIHLPAEEISKSLAKGHQLLGAWILTTPDYRACLSRVPGHRESKMYQILRSCRLVGRQATQESKEMLWFYLVYVFDHWWWWFSP